MTEAQIGYNTGYFIKQSGLFVEIGEVITVTPGEATSDRVDATHMKSAGRKREYISGLIDPGEASFEINWIPGGPTDQILRNLFDSGETVEHKQVYPNGVACIYQAQITGYSKAVPIDDRMTATITVSISGDETWEEAAAPVNRLLPSIAGIAQVGQVLTAVPGNWDNSPSFTYQWQVNGGSWANISGATARTYTPVVGQVGNPIRCIVTGTNSEGSASATSGATANVIAA
jgi:predicted secreted protein